MSKANLINLIIQYLKGLSGNNYQNAVKQILSTYFKSINKTYEMPSSFGGDDKNDGWVVEDSLFYQIYAPLQFPSTFATDLKEKFVEDLDGLLKIVYIDKKWNGKVEQFIFIVNTRDTSLPKDPERFFEKTLNTLKNKYSISNEILYLVTDNDYFYELLNELEETKLEYIVMKLNIQGLVNYCKTSSSDIINFIDAISSSLNEASIQSIGADYKRISSNEKIRINDLGEKQERILSIIPKLNIVDKAIEVFSQSIDKSELFETVKNKYIEIYSLLSKDFRGSELYDKILEEILDFAPTLKAFKVPAEMILVYIFDRCDMFEKEETL